MLKIVYPTKLGAAITLEFPKRLRVLVADDFESMQTAIVNSLQTLDGLEVIGTALNGQEALRLSGCLLPDLVVADLQMPIMDGFKLLRELRKCYPAIRLIAVSGHFSPAIEKEAIAAGADLFVSKVGMPGDLLSAVKQLLAA